MITVFTPTYNRAYIIRNLYESLCRQSDKEFEWLVVDDGSTDNTEELIQSFISEEKITIRYFYKTNGGKHTAINMGVQEAAGELFFIVDSDDYITDDALELLWCYYLQIKDDDKYCGISGLCIYPDGKTMGGEVTYNILHCRFWDYWHVYKNSGDKADAFKTDVIRQFPYPEVEGENFVSEVVVVNRIAAQYPYLLYFSKPLKVCEYLDDGLSRNSVKLRQKNSTLTLLLYEEQSKYPLPFSAKLKSVVNFWRFSFCSSMPFNQKRRRVSVVYSIVAFPVGLLLHIIDNFKLKK